MRVPNLRVAARPFTSVYCSFIGRKIVEALRKGGQRVIVLDRKPMPDIPAWRVGELVRYIQCDIRDAAGVTRSGIPRRTHSMTWVLITGPVPE